MDMSTNSSGEQHCGLVTGYLYAAWICIYVLIIPVLFFVLYLGYQHRTSGTSAAVSSHADIFTFNMIVLEILNLVTLCVLCGGFITGNLSLIGIGRSGMFVAILGQVSFHDLTCVERYLAVVHPIIYLRLKKKSGVRIRNVCIVCVWLFSFTIVNFNNSQTMKNFQLLYTIIVAILSLIIVSFCTVSVLCVLIRPGPGEGGGDRRKINQSKRAAFYTMVFILAALLSKFLIIFLSYGLFLASMVSFNVTCLLSVTVFWFGLPSSLVLPLLFLHRARKLTKFLLLCSAAGKCCAADSRTNTEK